MKIFYSIKTSILKTTIVNCENLLYKLKNCEEQNYEADNFDENIQDKSSCSKKNNSIKKEITISDNNNLNEIIENKAHQISSFSGISFVILYGFFILISYSCYIYNGIKILQ